MRTKGYKCYNIKCGSCVGKTLCGEPDDSALGCVDRLVNTMTNADSIRSMSDEELAELLANETYRIAKPCFDAFGVEKSVIYAKRLDWLQQPCEGGTDRAD